MLLGLGCMEAVMIKMMTAMLCKKYTDGQSMKAYMLKNVYEGLNAQKCV